LAGGKEVFAEILFCRSTALFFAFGSRVPELFFASFAVSKLLRLVSCLGFACFCSIYFHFLGADKELFE